MNLFKNSLKVLFIILLLTSCGKLTEKRLRKTHNALFETFLPLEKITDSETRKLAHIKKDEIWENLKNQNNYKALLLGLLKVKNLMDLKKGEMIYRDFTFETERLEELDPWNLVWVEDFLKTKKTKGNNPYFYKLAIKERRLLINLLSRGFI